MSKGECWLMGFLHGLFVCAITWALVRQGVL